MKPSVKVDTVPFWHFMVATGVACLFVLIAFIVGITGPASKNQSISYSYGCPNNSHTWRKAFCNGTQLGFGNRTYNMGTWALSPMNRFWIIRIIPFNAGWTQGQEDSTIPMKIRIETNVSHRNNVKEAWTDEVTNDWVEVTTTCPKISRSAASQGKCDEFTLIYEQTIATKYHSASFFFTVEEQTPERHLGDVGFKMITGTVAFSSMELVINICFLVGSLAVFLAFIWILHGYSISEWSFEHKCITILLIGLILYNNPFFSLKYLAPGWFFIVFDSIAKTTFIAALLLFWLLLLDKLRSSGDEEWQIKSFNHIPMFITVGIYWILSVITFAWVALQDRSNPVLGSPFEIAGVTVLYVLSAITVVAVLVWLVVVSVLSIKNVTASPIIFARFIYFIIPAFIVCVSLLGGIFSGGFGASARTAIELCYFTVLYNLYVWLLVYGYWPSNSPYRNVGNPKANPAIDEEEDESDESTPVASQPAPDPIQEPPKTTQPTTSSN